MRTFSILTCALLAGLTITLSGVAGAAECRRTCDGPVVNAGAGELTASYLSELTGTIRVASNRKLALQPYVWRLRTNCQVGDATQGACAPIATSCPTTPGRLIQLYLVQHRPIVQASGTGPNGEAPPPGIATGAAFGNWVNEGFSCVDVTDLNPPPSQGSCKVLNALIGLLVRP